MPSDSRFSIFHLSFRYKLFLIFTILTTLVSVIFSSMYVIGQIHESRRQAAEQLRLQAENLGNVIRLPLYALDVESVNRFAREASRLPQISSVVIRDAGGRVLSEYHSPHPVEESELISQTVAIQSTSLGFSIESALGGEGEKEPTIIGKVTLERETSDLAATTHRMAIVTCFVGFAFWALVTVLSYLVLRKVTDSFSELMRGVKRMQDGNFTTAIPVKSNDEPGRAALAINALARSLLEREEENARLNQELVEAARAESEVAAKLVSINSKLEQEIRERIHAEQSVRMSEQYLRRLVDAMPVGVAWATPTGKVEYVNNFIVERVGYARSEFTTIDEWYERIFPDPDYRRQISELRHDAFNRAGNGAEPPTYEARVTCKDGMVRHVIFKHQIYAERSLSIFIDITERELFQEQLIKTQKLESLGVLAGGIAHNFNNVLTGVLGYISFARMFLDKSEKAYEALVNAEKASLRAAGMARQLLTFARGGDPVKCPVSVDKLVRECLTLSLNGKNVRHVIDIPASIHAVNGDEGQLIQAFNNIILNAAQAMPDGGTITVRAENTIMPSKHTLCAPETDFVKISFMDEGEGIPDAIISKIFDPYFTTKPTGTGLGLASAHSIIKKHGGLISVHSEPGTGTTFTICIPATGATPTASESAARRLASGGRGLVKILVMDDEDVVREFADDTLKFLGYRVTVCDRGERAVELYREASESNEPFFAAILDLVVPDGMGGAETAKTILDFDPSAKLIVSSGYAYDPIMASFREYGFCAAISKPYKVDQLSQQLAFLHTDAQCD